MWKNLLLRDKKYLTPRHNSAQMHQNRRPNRKKSLRMKIQKNSTQKTKTQKIPSTVISMSRKTKSMVMTAISTSKPIKNGKKNTQTKNQRTSMMRRVLKTKKDSKMT